MAGLDRMGPLIGLDIGRVNTRVSVFGINGGKYRLQGCQTARTDFGYDGHLAAGVQQALEILQHDLERNFIPPSTSQLGPVMINQQVVEQMGLALSVFPQLNAALFGLTARGSLAGGIALAGKLPVNLLGAYGLAELVDETAVVKSLLNSRPALMILTGGTDSGAEASLERWVEVVRLVCRTLPEEVSPIVFFAGNPVLEPLVRRRLDPTCRLFTLPNLQPVVGEWDDIPSQSAIIGQILSLSTRKLSGLQGLIQLSGDLASTRGFLLDRMVRFVSRSKNKRSRFGEPARILAVDIGGGSTMVCAGEEGRSAAFRSPIWDGRSLEDWLSAAGEFVYHWTAAPLRQAEVARYLANQHLFPGTIPQTLSELAVSQSLARYRIRSAMAGLAERNTGSDYDDVKGLQGHYETVIASGAVLTAAPTAGQALLILLDGLQPWREVRFVLDRQHILPLLGLLGEAEPLLPVHVLDSDAFVSLGTVVPVVSEESEGVLIASINVAMESGKAYEVDIPQGALRRLIIPPGEAVSLVLEPISGVDVGAGPGVSRKIKVRGGLLGVVIDARGRPLNLPKDDEARVERLRSWLWVLGG